VFDTRKFSFLITSGGGAGVVVDKASGAKTYMNMFTGGAGLGVGMQFFQVVFFFEDKASLDRFVSQGWEANAAATAVFGEDSLEKNARFVEGMAVYQMNDAGIMADMNITGTKYWQSTKLNG
jgi:lipid-binding SYLF domain-containing protein